MYNLYSITTNQEAIRTLFAVLRDLTKTSRLCPLSSPMASLGDPHDVRVSVS
jgi:hypothetical protein